MVLFFALYGATLADPVTLVQLRYPAHRVTIVAPSGSRVVYTVASDAPPELKRAYKALEIAEREVMITEALQMLRAEVVANERLLESLRTIRLAAYLTNTRASSRVISFDPYVNAPRESFLRMRIGDSLAEDAKVERALLALDRLVDAHYQLHLTLLSIAYPDRRPAAVAKPPAALSPLPLPAPAVAPAAGALAEAEKAEKAAADAELFAEERERDARQKERAADAKYRDAEPVDRPAARAEWLKARDAWEQARRDWDAAREKWQAARDQLGALRKAQRAAANDQLARPAFNPGAPPR
jgi:hypothetical protein